MTVIALKELKQAADVSEDCRPPKKLVLRQLYNPELSVKYGACYLDLMLTRYGTPTRALLAYNGGGRQVNNLRTHRRMSYESLQYVSRIYDYLEQCDLGQELRR